MAIRSKATKKSQSQSPVAVKWLSQGLEAEQASLLLSTGKALLPPRAPSLSPNLSPSLSEWSRLLALTMALLPTEAGRAEAEEQVQVVEEEVEVEEEEDAVDLALPQLTSRLLIWMLRWIATWPSARQGRRSKPGGSSDSKAEGGRVEKAAQRALRLINSHLR
jgi:hypothetical protein